MVCSWGPGNTSTCTGTEPLRGGDPIARAGSRVGQRSRAGTSLKGSAGVFARGLEWCLENDVTIANLSLSTTNERWAETFHHLVDAASFRRMMLVSSMANERKRTIPSEYAGVFSVACGPDSDRERIWCNPNAPGRVGRTGHRRRGRVERAFDDHCNRQQLCRARDRRTPGTDHVAHPDLTTWQAEPVLAAARRQHVRRRLPSARARANARRRRRPPRPRPHGRSRRR